MDAWFGRFVGVAALLALLGCVDLPEDSSPVELWVLSPVDAEPSTVAPVRTLSVGPVTLPGYLQRLEIVLREGDHRLRVERFDRWGDALDAQIESVLAQDLARLAPGTSAATYPWPGDLRPELQLQVDVTSFEAEPSGAVLLEADWQLLRVAGGELVAHRVARITEDAGGSDLEGIVAAMSRAVAELARQVVADLPAPGA